MNFRWDPAFTLGIDLGGTKILVGVVDREGNVISRAKRSTPASEGGPAIVTAILDAAGEAIQSSGLSSDQVALAGIGSPGPLDVHAGVIRWSANLNVRDFPIASELSRGLGCPVALENDVRAGGYAEYRLGAGRDYRNVVFAFVGTGIGGCVVVNGELIDGVTHNAGELGHMVIKVGGPRCGCGSRGCVESLASKTAIARRIQKAVRKGLPSVLGERIARKGRLKSRDLAEAVQAKDLVALNEVQRSAHFLGVGLGNLINVLGPEAVVIGGGVSHALGDSYTEMVANSAHNRAIADPEHVTIIRRAALGDNAGILGAAIIAQERFAQGEIPRAHHPESAQPALAAPPGSKA